MKGVSVVRGGLRATTRSPPPAGYHRLRALCSTQRSYQSRSEPRPLSNRRRIQPSRLFDRRSTSGSCMVNALLSHSSFVASTVWAEVAEGHPEVPEIGE